MKIGILSHEGATGLGAVYGGQWVELAGALGRMGMPAPAELRAFIRAYQDGVPELDARLREALASGGIEAYCHPVSQSRFLPPIPAAPRLQTARGNSTLFTRCTKSPLPKQPALELRTNFNIVGHDSTFELRDGGGWNLEIVMVMGRDARNVSRENAYDFVFGYTSMLDHSGGETRRNPYWAGNAFSIPESEKKFIDIAYGGNWNWNARVPVPVGPVIVTRDEIPDPHAMLQKETETGRLISLVHTSAVLFTFPEIVEYLSSMMTLEAGDMFSSASIGYDGYSVPDGRLPKGAYYQGETDKLPPLRLNVVDCRDHKAEEGAK